MTQTTQADTTPEPASATAPPHNQHTAPADGRGPLGDVLDGRWQHVRERARELAADPRFIPDTTAYPDIETLRAECFERLKALADTGDSGLGFPARYGGQDDVGGSITAFEMLAMGDLSLMVKAGVQWGLFGGAILHLGTERHHAAYLPDVISAELPGCFAMTETGHGSNVAHLLTTATYDPDAQEFEIHTPSAAARKDYIGNAARDGRLAVVFAQLVTGGQTQGVHAFLVPIRDEDGRPSPGVTIEDDGPKAGLNGVDNGRLSFDHVRVPRVALLNRYADVAEDGTYTTPIENRTKRFFTMLGTLVQGRISVAGGAASAAKVALSIALHYGERRRQFSQDDDGEEYLVMDYLAHQRKLLPALSKTYALHFAQLAMVADLDATTPRLEDEAAAVAGAGDDAGAGQDGAVPDRRELEARAAGIKAIGTWHASATIQACREACGGAGYLAENRLPALRADTDVFTTFEGDNTVLLQLVAKELLTGFRDHFGELDQLGMARFVADQAVDVVLERTGARRMLQRLADAVPRRDQDAAGDLRDRDWHFAVFDWREKHLLETVARRLQRALKADDPFSVFNAAQPHLLALARAHVDSLLLDGFVTAIEAAPESVRPLLDQVCDLFALQTIEAERAWLQEHGQLTASRSKAVIAAVDALCLELRPRALELIDGFGIPPSAIDVAILRD